MMQTRRFASSSTIPKFIFARFGSSISVILLEKLDRKGDCGDEIKVKRGFARNYLIPRKKAVYATELNKIKWKAINIAAVVETIDRPIISKQIFERAASSSGSLFGSVNAADVKERLISQGIHVTDMEFEPLKMIGIHTIHVNGEAVTVEIIEPKKEN